MADLPRTIPPILARNLDVLALGAALAALLVALVVAVCRLGRRLERHRQWLLVLEDRVSGRGDRLSRDVQRLSLHTPRPPPLSQAPTVEIDEQDLLDRFDKTRLRPPKPRTPE